MKILFGTMCVPTRYMMVFFMVLVCMWLHAWSMPWTLSESTLCPTKSQRKKQRKNRLLKGEILMATWDFKEKLDLDSWLLLIMIVGIFLAAGSMLLLELLRILWEYLPI